MLEPLASIPGMRSPRLRGLDDALLVAVTEKRSLRPRPARRGADGGGRLMELIHEKSRTGRRAASAASRRPEGRRSTRLRRSTPPRLPEVSEPELVRHITALADRNFGIDNGFYPLGSCTMKHNRV